jgi:hypothetical protein
MSFRQKLLGHFFGGFSSYRHSSPSCMRCVAHRHRRPFSRPPAKGLEEALWIVFPGVPALLDAARVHDCARQGHGPRTMDRTRRDQDAAGAYIRKVATGSRSEEISKSKALLTQAPSADKFERIKTRFTY